MLVSTTFAAPSAQPSDRTDQKDQKQTNMEELIMLNPSEIYLGGADCKEDERVVLGMLPECEPSCDDPRPICPRIFTVLDKPFCFCNEPLVRHKQSNRCIPLDQCESNSQ